MDGIREDRILKVTFFHHFVASYSTFLLALIFGAILYLVHFNSSFVVVLGIFFIIDTLPALYLHIRYWIKNGGKQYKVDSNGIIQIRKNEERLIKKSDIQKIIVTKSASSDKGGIPILSIESYYFTRVVLKTGEDLVLTCLVSPKIDKVLRNLNGVLFERKKCFFCFV